MYFLLKKEMGKKKAGKSSCSRWGKNRTRERTG